MFKAIIVWFICLMFLLAIILFFIPSTWIEQVTAQEKQVAYEQFGRERTEKVLVNAHNTFNVMFVDTGIEQQTFSFFIPKKNAEAKPMDGMAGDFFGMMYGRLAAFWAAVYQGLIRGYFFISWVPYLLPFIIAVVVDALVVRKVRIENFEFASPQYYGFATHMMIFGFFSIFYYFLAPFTVTFVMVPIWAIGMMGMLHLLITNLQRTR